MDRDAHLYTPKQISIHSLRMEGDRTVQETECTAHQFQSTPSVWRETTARGRDLRVCGISIHSLRMEGDAIFSPVSFYFFSFQSTPSVWRETFPEFLFRDIIVISIHSLRMEGDVNHCIYYTPLCAFQSTPSVWRETHISGAYGRSYRNFNPLPPYGGRPDLVCFCLAYHRFQSTPSVWRETFFYNIFAIPLEISIHSLRMEGDDQGI